MRLTVGAYVANNNTMTLWDVTVPSTPNASYTVGGTYAGRQVIVTLRDGSASVGGGNIYYVTGYA